MKKIVLLLAIICSLNVHAQQSHIIQRGETLESLAARYGTTQAEIKGLNPLVDVYCVGMEIVLPMQKQTSNSEYAAEPSVTKKEKHGSGFWSAFGNAVVNTLGTMGNAYVQRNTYMATPSTMPSYYPSMNTNVDWGTGFAGGMTYSNDPILNSTIGMAMSEQRLMNAGVTITGISDFDRYKPTTKKDAGWIFTPSTASYGQDRPYVTCSNCGVTYQQGSGHMCKIK